jgi:uncharacterized protein (DUF1810 family)
VPRGSVRVVFADIDDVSLCLEAALVTLARDARDYVVERIAAFYR